MLSNSSNRRHRSCSTGRSATSSRVSRSDSLNHAKNPIPGYAGHIPGIDPEMIFGASRARLSEKGPLARPRMRSHAAGRINAEGLDFRPGLDIVGYTGFVPGKHADNIYGRTFSKANSLSQEIKRLQYKNSTLGKDEVVSSLEEFKIQKPSNQSGNFQLYSRPLSRVIPTS
jgi:hypothetical protein